MEFQRSQPHMCTAQTPVLGSFLSTTKHTITRYSRISVGVGRPRVTLPHVRQGGMSGKRSVVVTRAFLGGFSSKAEPITIKLNFYALLHVSQRANKETIFRSYERMVSNPPEVGFSEQALHARTAILEGAMETLGTSSIRKEYDERLAMGAVDETIPPKFVSGVLILLHEAGQYDLVISAGLRWLNGCSNHKFARDVATVVSCSYLTTSTEMIDARESLHDAKANLMQAKSLLETYGGSSQVLDIVNSMINDLGPRLALELISSAEPDKRHEGIVLLPLAMQAMKKESDTDRRSQQSWISYLDRIRQLLSAEELIELFNVSEKLFTDPRELYYVAVAHIAAGVDKSEPVLIRTANDLLLKAEKIAKRTHSGKKEYSMAGIRSRQIVEEQQRRSMGLCCTSLLLGDSGKAATFLGLRDEPMTCDRQIYTFVKNNSRGSDSLLPGLCVLVERWVNDVALSSFYKNPATFSLNEWFENPKIVHFVENIHRPNGIVVGAKGALASIVGPVIRFFTNDRGDSVESTASVEKDTGYDVEEKEEESTWVAEPKAEPQNAYAPVPEPPAATPAPMPMTSTYDTSSDDTVDYDEPKELKMPEPLPLARIQEEVADDLSTNENLYLKGMDLDNVKIFDDLPRSLNENSIATLGGEEGWIRSAYEARRVRWGRVSATALLLLAAISAPLGRLGGHSILTKYIPAARIGHRTSSLSKSEAHAIIQRWQLAKADALGKHYKTDNLHKVLGEPLVKEWSTRARDLKNKGLYYVHKSHSCKIRDITEISSGNHLILADIKESIVVHRGDGSSPQTVPSSYRVQYEIVQTADGWRLHSATIQT